VARRRRHARELVEYGESWRQHHPGWKFRLWRDRDLLRLVPSDAVARARHHAELFDLLRFEVLRRCGGVYVDTDVECLRSLEPLLEGERVVLGYEKPGRVGSAIVAAVPGHPLLVDAAQQAQKTVGLGANSADATGPYLLTLLARDYPDVRILAAEGVLPLLVGRTRAARRRIPEVVRSPSLDESGPVEIAQDSGQDQAVRQATCFPRSSALRFRAICSRFRRMLARHSAIHSACFRRRSASSSSWCSLNERLA
jgi:hypothetical protein